eukprot:scaffold20547_cov31-Attheya_sp.AAC.1
METLGRTMGYLFVNIQMEQRAECSQYEKSIFDKLREIQVSNPELIELECEIEEEFGMQRSFRRGFDTECRNCRVKEADINLMCRWQVEKVRQGRSSARSMLDLEDVAHSKGEGKAVTNNWRVGIDTLKDFGTNLEA